jgi:flagellar biosynthesis protein FliR
MYSFITKISLGYISKLIKNINIYLETIISNLRIKFSIVMFLYTGLQSYKN